MGNAPRDFEDLAAALRAEASEAGPAASRAALQAAHDADAATGAQRLPWIDLALEAGHLDLASAWLKAGLAEAPDDGDLVNEASWLHTALADLAPTATSAAPRGVVGLSTTAPPQVAAPSDPSAEDGSGTPTRTWSLDARPATAAIDDRAVPAGPTAEDLSRLAHRFAGREGLHARQWFDAQRQRGGYAPVRAPLTPRLLAEHLAGKHTLGTYLMRVDNTVTQVVFDLDVSRRAIDASAGQPDGIRALRTGVADAGLRLHRFLATLGLPGLLFDSGYKGRHVWLFLQAPAPASLAVNLGRAVRRVFPLSADFNLEVFPKQAQVDADGLGNLVKIPLGVHQRSQRRAQLLGGRGEALADPWPTMRAMPLVAGPAALLDALEDLRPLPGIEVLPAHTNDDQEVDAMGAPALGGLARRLGRREPSSSARTENDVLPPPPAMPPPLNLDTHPALSQIRRGCAVVHHLVYLARETRRLDHNQRVVVAHALGHLDDGPTVVNALFDHCPETPMSERLRRRLAGNPISCPKIRKRLPEITMHLPCHCVFPGTTDHYATPLLHVTEPRSRPGIGAGPTTDADGNPAPWED